jgi:enolase
LSAIVVIQGREILDSRGNPTVEAEVILASGIRGRAAVPSGATTGAHEAVELRDGDRKRYLGRGVRNAVENVNGPIAKALVGFEAREQLDVDRTMSELDGTPNRGALGANAILAVSMAVARAAAAEHQMPLWRYLADEGDATLLPVPMMNVLSGGARGRTRVDIQEFMLMPVGAGSFHEGLRMGVEVFHHLGKVLSAKGKSTAVGDDGGFVPDLDGNEEAVEVVLQAMEAAGYRPGEDVVLALDAAASALFEDGEYVFRRPGGERRDTAGMLEFWKEWVARYPIGSLEDPLDENDWNGWRALTAELGGKVQVVGDDLFVTNSARLERGIHQGSANAILVKVNQIGTLTETLQCMRTAARSGWRSILSHRAGETEDTFVADLAVAAETGQIKAGGPSRTDRVAKYNQLLRIEAELGARARYPGRDLWKR